MTIQKEHNSIQNSTHAFNIVVIAENIRTPENLGMIMRVCEAFAVSHIYFVGNLGIELTTKAKRASRNTYKLDNFDFLVDGLILVDKLKNEGYMLTALEITQNSIPIHKVKWPQLKIALIIGSEREGISNELLQQADNSVHINMYGENSSLNVTNALSIALHSLVESKK